MAMERTGRQDRGDGVELAWAELPGRGPAVVFLGGLRSDMEGSKALFLRDHCAASGQAFLRLDYSGHGRSGGDFLDGTVGRWAEDAAAVISARAPGPVILVGSSLGGWISLLLARRWGTGRVRAVIGLAAAPDFTQDLIPGELPVEERIALARDGVVHRPSPYGEPMPITARLLDEGRHHLLLDGGGIDYRGPVRLLQGMDDPDVPWRHALRIVEALPGSDVLLTLIRDGDHRLSRPSDLDLLRRVLAPLVGEDGGEA